MPTVTAEYLGDFRVSCKHEASGATIITDAPVEAKGKGEAFTPPDLCSTSLAACAMTIMALFADSHGLDVKGTTIEVNTIMAEKPHRISKIQVIFNMPPNGYSDKDKERLTRATKTCPVHLTLGDCVEQEFVFNWKS